MKCPVCDAELELINKEDCGMQYRYTYACDECQNELVYVFELEIVDGKRVVIEERWEMEDDLAEMSCDYLEGALCHTHK